MNIIKRLYEDFFRPSKLNDYERVVFRAQQLGYEFHTIRSFEKIIGNKDPNKKYFILRRDVDTKDIAFLKKMLAVENKYNARCSYYFRLSTVDYDFMRQIEESGGEASYHYEEVASYCYKHHTKDPKAVEENMDKIRMMFIRNFEELKKKSQLPLLTIASHGDFMNVKLGIKNCVIINEDIKRRLGIIREAYDTEHEQELDINIYDLGGGNYADIIIDALEKGFQTVEWLTHPRQWNSPVWINLKEEIERLVKGIYMKL